MRILFHIGLLLVLFSCTPGNIKIRKIKSNITDVYYFYNHILFNDNNYFIVGSNKKQIVVYKNINGFRTWKKYSLEVNDLDIENAIIKDSCIYILTTKNFYYDPTKFIDSYIFKFSIKDNSFKKIKEIKDSLAIYYFKDHKNNEFLIYRGNKYKTKLLVNNKKIHIFNSDLSNFKLKENVLYGSDELNGTIYKIDLLNMKIDSIFKRDFVIADYQIKKDTIFIIGYPIEGNIEKTSYIYTCDFNDKKWKAKIPIDIEEDVLPKSLCVKDNTINFLASKIIKNGFFFGTAESVFYKIRNNKTEKVEISWELGAFNSYTWRRNCKLIGFNLLGNFYLIE